MPFMIITCFIYVEGEMYKTFTSFSSFWGETWYLTFTEKRGFWVFEIMLLTRVFRIKRDRERETE
jgi:hypothetical protein